MRGRKSMGPTKVVKFKMHTDVYEFLKDVAKEQKISLAELLRRIIYRAVYEVSFPEAVRKARKKRLY